MSKFYGAIGYATVTETSPGVHVEGITERNYRGDWTRNYYKGQSSSNLNDDINISNELSIVGDPFAYENFHAMRYVTYMNSKWKISSVEIQWPRLNLTIGGVYNEQET